MSLLNHPAFQSLALPLLATLAALTLLGAWRKEQPRWAGLGAVLGLLVALAFFPGLEWPAASRSQKLPWIVLSAGLVSAAVLVVVGKRAHAASWLPWGVACGVWGWAAWWLAGALALWPLGVVAVVGGAVFLGMLLLAIAPPADASPVGAVAQAAVLAVLSAGLAALGALGGSLLLAQLGMALAVATGVLALWAWLAPVGGALCSAPALLPLGVAWLALAQVLSSTVASGLVRSALMALGLVVTPILSRTSWAARHPRWLPWVAVLLAVVPVALALLPVWGEMAGSPDGGSGQDVEDPYYRPAWE